MDSVALRVVTQNLLSKKRFFRAALCLDESLPHATFVSGFVDLIGPVDVLSRSFSVAIDASKGFGASTVSCDTGDLGVFAGLLAGLDFDDPEDFDASAGLGTF